MDNNDQTKAAPSGPKHKDSKLSFGLSLVFGVVLLVFAVQDFVAGKVLLGAILTLAGAAQLFMAYKIWGRRQRD